MSEVNLASKRGDKESVRALCREGVSIDDYDEEDGTTPLYWAACNGHVVLCDWLIQHGVDVNRLMKKSGSTALHAAADRGQADCVFLLIKNGANIDACTDKNWDTPLHLASYRGHGSVCRLLVDHGAMINLENRQRRTPKQEAQMRQHYELVMYLTRQEQARMQGILGEKPVSKTEDLTLFRRKEERPPKSMSGPLVASDSFFAYQRPMPSEQDEGVDDVDWGKPVTNGVSSHANTTQMRLVNTTGTGQENLQTGTGNMLNANYVTDIRQPVQKDHSNTSTGRCQDKDDVQEELEYLYSCIKDLHSKIKAKEEKINNLTLVNEQLRIYTHTYKETFQELRQVRQDLERQCSRASRAENELTLLKRRLRQLQPKGQWLMDQWSTLSKARSEDSVAPELNLLDVDYDGDDSLKNRDSFFENRHVSDWHLHTAPQLTSRSPNSDSEDEKSSNQSLEGKMMQLSGHPVEIPTSVDQTTSSSEHSAHGLAGDLTCFIAATLTSHVELYHALQPVFASLQPEMRDQLTNSLKQQLQRVSACCSGGLGSSDLVYKRDYVLSHAGRGFTTTKEEGQEEPLWDYAEVLIQGKPYMIRLNNPSSQTDYPDSDTSNTSKVLVPPQNVLSLPYHPFLGTSEERYGSPNGLQGDTQWLPMLLSCHPLQNGSTFTISDLGSLTFANFVNKMKTGLVAMSTQLKERMLLQMILQLGLSLVHMHNHSCIHGDVSVDNVVVDRNGMFKLAYGKHSQNVSLESDEHQHFTEEKQKDIGGLVNIAHEWCRICQLPMPSELVEVSPQKEVISPRIYSMMDMLSTGMLGLSDFTVSVWMLLYGPAVGEVSCERDCDTWLQARAMRLLTLPWRQLTHSPGLLDQHTSTLDRSVLTRCIARNDLVLETHVLPQLCGTTIWAAVQRGTGAPQ